MVKYRTVDIGDFEVFYREAGDPGSPTLLLLHGFPSSSHMFRKCAMRVASACWRAPG